MVTLEADDQIGQCLPVDESKCTLGPQVERCAAVMSNVPPDAQTEEIILPEHLREMFEGSILHLQPSEKQKFET